MGVKLNTYGYLSLDNINIITLEMLEEFCQEARKLGLGDKTKLQTSRQGLVGPITTWQFSVPVIPKPSDA